MANSLLIASVKDSTDAKPSVNSFAISFGAVQEELLHLQRKTTIPLLNDLTPTVEAFQFECTNGQDCNQTVSMTTLERNVLQENQSNCGASPSASSCSLNSGDLMLTTDVGLDTEDDDVCKDLYGSEKEDPFLQGWRSQAKRCSASSNGNETLLSPTATDNVVEVNKPLLRRLRSMPRQQRPRSLSSPKSPPTRLSAEVSIPGSGNNTSGNASHVMMTQSMHESYGNGSILDRPFKILPYTALPEEVEDDESDTVSSTKPQQTRAQSEELNSSAWDPPVMFFSSDCRQMMQEMSRMKLTLLKMRRMLIQDEGHVPTFRLDMSSIRSPTSPLTHTTTKPILTQQQQQQQTYRSDCFSEPATPLESIHAVAFANQTGDVTDWKDSELLEKMENKQLIEVINHLQHEIMSMQTKLTDQENVIQLLQTQMTKYIHIGSDVHSPPNAISDKPAMPASVRRSATSMESSKEPPASNVQSRFPILSIGTKVVSPQESLSQFPTNSSQPYDARFSRPNCLSVRRHVSVSNPPLVNRVPPSLARGHLPSQSHAPR